MYLLCIQRLIYLIQSTTVVKTLLNSHQLLLLAAQSFIRMTLEFILTHPHMLCTALLLYVFLHTRQMCVDPKQTTV